MQPARTDRRDAHDEIYIGDRGGEIIRVSCECPLGHDHSFAEWRRRFEIADGPGRRRIATTRRARS